MSYKKFLGILIAVAAIGWVSFGLVVAKLEPCTGPGEITFCHSIAGFSIFLFFLSAFFALTASFALIGFGLRFWFHRYEMYLDHLGVSLRQGVLLAAGALLALGLLLLNALTWWSGAILIAIILLVELYFTRTLDS